MSFAEVSAPSGNDYLNAMRRQSGGGNDIPIYKGRSRRVGRGGRKKRRKRGGFAFVPALVTGLARVAGILRSPAVKKALSTIGSTGAKTAATVGTHYGFQEMARKLRGKGRRRGRRKKKKLVGGRKSIKGTRKRGRRIVKHKPRRRRTKRKPDIFD
jgi:hypothetical protein